MRLRALLRRLVLPPVVSGLAVSGLALPAQADSLTDFPLLILGVTETVTVVDGQSKTVKFDVYNIGGGTAKNVVVGFSSVPDDIGFVPPAGCSATACKLSELAGGQRHHYSFTVKPKATSIPNLAMKFDMSVAADNQDFDDDEPYEVQVVRTTKTGADLEIGDIDDLKLGRGKSAALPVTVTNTGNAESTTLGLVVLAEDGVEPDLDYRNCEKDATIGGVICVTDEKLAPGATVTVDPKTPVKIKVGADTPGPFSYFTEVVATGLTDKYVTAFRKRAATRTGTDLVLKKSVAAADITDGDISDDLNPDDNVVDFTVAVPLSSADSKAIGGAFHGAVGDRVTVKVGAQNLGPTATIPVDFASIPYVHVQLPTGITVTKPGVMCLPGTSPEDIDLTGATSRDWACLQLDQLHKGDKGLFEFTALIQDGSHDAGFVQTGGGVQDTNHDNDKAALTVDLDDSLPLTGPSTGLLAGGGVLLLVAGIIAFRLARRRRIITVVE